MKRAIGALLLCGMLAAIPAFAQPQGMKDPKGPVPVTAAAVAAKDFSDAVEALGTTRANETVVITAKLADTVKEIHFDDGQTVKKDDVLLVLDSDEEEANLRSAEAQAAERRSAYKRAQGLEEKQIVSRASYEEKQAQLRQAEADIQSIKSRIADTVIKAPFDGMLGLRSVSVGALVRPGDRITTIDDLSQMKVDFDVPATYLQQLKPGLPVTGTVEGFAEREFSGVIAMIDTQIDTVTRTAKVRAVLPNADLLLRPGLLMNISLHLNPRQAMVVPEGALVQQKDKSFVYIVEEKDGKSFVKKTEVQRGARRFGEAEILSGLAEGQRVVVAGGMNIADGQEVKISEGFK